MSIEPICDRCLEPLTEFGALLFGPPDPPLTIVQKLHLCPGCYSLVVNSFPSLPAPETPEGGKP